MAITDIVAGRVEVVWSNIGEEWCASLVAEDGKTLASATADTRADVLRNLADELDARD